MSDYIIVQVSPKRWAVAEQKGKSDGVNECKVITKATTRDQALEAALLILDVDEKDYPGWLEDLIIE